MGKAMTKATRKVKPLSAAAAKTCRVAREGAAAPAQAPSLSHAPRRSSSRKPSMPTLGENSADTHWPTPSSPRPQLDSPVVVPVKRHKLSFYETFGTLGLLIATVVAISLTWTAWLVFLTLAPTRTANFLMGTEAYDDGRFWLIRDLDTLTLALSTAGLLTVAAAYLYILLKMLIWQNRSLSVPGSKLCARLVQWERLKTSRVFQSRVATTLANSWRELTSFHGTHRKSWNVCLKAVDLALQMLSLHQMLESGSPLGLVTGYTAAICANALSVVFFVLSATHSAFTEIIVDSIFDLFFAVLIPIVGLSYSYSYFKFDRAEYELNVEVMPAGSFERRGRMIADPAQIMLFQAGLDALRILTLGSLFIRLGMNLSFCNRLRRVVEVLIERQQKRLIRRLNRRPTVHDKMQVPVHRSAALVFLLFSIAVVVYVHGAVSASAARCQAYPECVAFAFRWRTSGQCPCLTLIHADRAPTTYDDWIHPIDATQSVKALAASGTLRVLQLINRQLLQWPEELRRCRDLRYISMFYTGLEQVPAWAKEFKQLEYLHIEGRQGMRNLVELPDDLFDDLPALTYLQLGVQRDMQRLPPLEGVPNLISLVLARMFSITELPSLAHLGKLERLEFTYLPLLTHVPDMAALKKLIHFVVYRPSHMCCNGFITQCDLTDIFCAAYAPLSLPLATCVTNASHRATSATRTFFQVHKSEVCQRLKSLAPLISDPPAQLTIEMCGGIPYRQCWLPLVDGTTAVGLCYRSRMQALACSIDPNKIKLRQLQIQRRIGPACDPSVEGWLGCTH